MKEGRDLSIHLDREAGYSIREIAQRNGCSTTTVQKVLKQTPPVDISLSKAVEEVFLLASREEGVLFSEEYECVKGIIGDVEKGIISRIRRRVKARAKKEGKEVLFIPNWLGRDNQEDKVTLLMSLANELHERMYDCIEEFVGATGASWNECQEVILSLAIPGYSDIPVSVQCDRINEIIYKEK